MLDTDIDPADVLICQPAVLLPSQLDFALGVQHAWVCELAQRGVRAHPVFLGRPAGGSGSQMLYHRDPRPLHQIRELYRRRPDGLPAAVLRSKLFVADERVGHAEASLAILHGQRVVRKSRSYGNLTRLLAWVDAVVTDICRHFDRHDAAPRWQKTYDTEDPNEAAYLLHLSGAIIRENMCLLDDPVLMSAKPLPLASYLD
jgi:hypothetical protein